MSRRAIAAVALTAVVALAAISGFLIQRGRMAEQQQAAVVASADAVRATAVEPFLERLRRVRTVTFESVDAAHSSRMAVLAVVRQEQRAEEQRLEAAQAAAEQQAAAQDPTSSGGSGSDTGATQEAARRPSGGLVIGDSVSLGAESCLNPLGYRVDAEVGRQFTTGLDHLRVHAADGLPRSVVLHLGTNGPFTSSGFAEAMSLAGDRRVVWVTIALPPRSQYSFVDSLNDMIRSQAAAHDNVRVADFARAAAAHPEWMAGDGIHITGSGCTGFADLVDDAVTRP